MEELTSIILNKINNISLEDLAEDFPTTITTDAHILKAEDYYHKGELWESFHHLSLTHSTLLYHRLSQKLNRPQKNGGISSTTISSTEDNLSEQFSKASLADFANNQVLRPSTSEETKRYLQMLPSDWTVVQITSENKQSRDKRVWKKFDDPLHTPPLYISRCRCGTTPSVIIKRVVPPANDQLVRSLLQEMELIKGENKVISKYYKSDQQKYFEKKEEINNRLRALVQSMESGWLRHFSCLLTGSLQPNIEVTIRKRVKEALQECDIAASEEQLTLLTLMVGYPLPTNATKGNIQFDYPLRAGVASVLEESARSPKVKNLLSSLMRVQEKMKDLRMTSRNSVILVIDKCVVSLPWEMNQALRDQSVTRMPSLQSLVYLYLHHLQKADSLLTKGIDASNGFFILDPDNNLPRSQERLQETFSLTKWDGIRGQRPSHDQFRDALSTKDIFVYAGHGSGSLYMPAHLVETLECRSLVLLYGCSSASLARRGSTPDPWGVILNYLIASCPCVVGMLWEVMDKDTDLLTKEMIRAIKGIKGVSGCPLEDPPSDIALLVAKARPLCSWYMISAALVVYGLPLQVVSQPSNENTS